MNQIEGIVAATSGRLLSVWGRRCRAGLVMSVALGALSAGTLHAQIVMTAQDTLNESSFNTAGHWSSEAAPTAGNTYETTYTLRTPTAAGDYVFAGDSLTLSSGGKMAYKGVDGYTITCNFILNGGVINNVQVSTFTLAGTISLAQTSQIQATTGTITINSLISGGSDAVLSINTYGLSSPDLTGGVILTNSSNSYTGGTLITRYASLEVVADGALGTGDVTLYTGSSLKLNSGATNDYIDNSANLIIDVDAYQVVLDYTGSDNIAGLSIDGGETFLSAGTYGAVGSGAEYELEILSGTGYLTVIPESSSFGLITGALLIVATWGRFRRS